MNVLSLSRPLETIIEAIEGNLYASGTTQFAKWPRFEVHEEPQVLWYMCDVSSPMFNVVQRARWPAADEARQAIADLQLRYAERELPIQWWVGPSSTPRDLSRLLTNSGFVPDGEMTGMAIDLEHFDIPPHPDNLRIETVINGESLATLARTMCLGFELSQEIIEPMIDLTLAMGYGEEGPYINYLGTLDGRPVATSSLFLDSDVAGIYNVAVVPEVRRQGIGSAVTAAALLEAAKRGYRLAVLHSTANAIPMYQQLGFKTFCYFHLYLWIGPGSESIHSDPTGHIER